MPPGSAQIGSSGVLGWERLAPDAVRCGRTVLRFAERNDVTAAPALPLRGWAYLTVQVHDCDEEHSAVLRVGGVEGAPPVTMGDVARFSMVRDPAGNWLELSQRASLTGPLPRRGSPRRSPDGGQGVAPGGHLHSAPMDDDGSQIGVDVEALVAWMDRRGLGEGPLTDRELIAGGTQNVLLRFRRSGEEFVLRRPPLHKRPNSDETMRREARLLAALAGSDVPHPTLIAAEPDEGVLGAAFYLMQSVAGFNAGLGLPEPHASDRQMQFAMGLSMADAIAALGRIDHAVVGLGDFGKPAGWLERQVGRWRSQLDSYAALEGYRGVDVPGVERVAAWLDAHQPSHWRPGLIHGDFHFSNVLIRPDRGELAAIVDWELTTVGDPLLDLGHLLVTWPTRPHGVAGTLSAANLPNADELISRYAGGSDRDLSAIGWYQVLACYRLGIILEGTNARADAGMAPRETGDMLHAHTVALFEQALELIGG